jgi:hypothetical protein
MQLGDYERGVLRDLAFFTEDTDFLGIALRPVSLLSWKAMEMMKLELIHDDVDSTAEVRTREIAVFLWLHSAPLPEVCAGLWDNSWRAIHQSAAEPAPELVQAFNAWWIRVLMMVAAAKIAIRPKPKVAGDKTPRDLYWVEDLAQKVGHIAAFTGSSRHEVKWQMFIGEALQHFHCAMRWHGQWTVKPGAKVEQADCEDLVPEALKGMVGGPAVSGNAES